MSARMFRAYIRYYEYSALCSLSMNTYLYIGGVFVLVSVSFGLSLSFDIGRTEHLSTSFAERNEEENMRYVGNVYAFKVERAVFVSSVQLAHRILPTQSVSANDI